MLRTTRRSRKRRVVSQFEDLQACYLSLRRGAAAAAGGSSGDLAAADEPSAAENGFANGTAGSNGSAAHAEPDQAGGSGNGHAAAMEGVGGPEGGDHERQLVSRGERPLGAVMQRNGFAEFSRMLSVFTHCSKLKARGGAAQNVCPMHCRHGQSSRTRCGCMQVPCQQSAGACMAFSVNAVLCLQVIAELPRASPRQSAAILSSIEFDRDRRALLCCLPALDSFPWASQCRGAKVLPLGSGSCMTARPGQPLGSVCAQSCSSLHVILS